MLNKRDIENLNNDFFCCECNRKVVYTNNIGTAHRNHCPYCLYSKHVDKNFSGDRASDCYGRMKAVGLSFKKESKNKYKKEDGGELMIIHQCENCLDISINRLARDDEEIQIITLFNQSLLLSPDIKKNIIENGIQIAEEKDRDKVFIRLFGKGINQF